MIQLVRIRGSKGDVWLNPASVRAVLPGLNATVMVLEGLQMEIPGVKPELVVKALAGEEIAAAPANEAHKLCGGILRP